MWSDEKDGVPLDKTPCDMVGLDTISDNIISDESPDDDEYLFDANEFLNLNKKTDPDMFLKFQVRQAEYNAC